ncbi:MAG: hypothetical protein RLZZ488_737 [Pseudomonadota bacterium]|jgi:hypothetical protein
MQFSLKMNVDHSIPEQGQVSTSGWLQLRRCAALFACAGLSCLVPQQGAAAEFRIGLAQIDISTRATIPMGGYGTFFLATPRMNGNGIHDPLYAAAVVFESAAGERAAILALDAVGLSATQISRIEVKAREAVDANLHLIVSASHTHHSPDTLGLWGSLPKSGRNSRYAEQLETAAVQAVRDAFAKLQPARMTKRTGRHQNSTSALSNPAEVQDSFVSLSFYSVDNENLLGTFTQWGAHPTVIGMNNNTLSSDFIGGFRKSMERLAGNVPHLYVNGVVGKVYPIIPPVGDPTLIDDLFPEGDKDPDIKDEYKNASTVGFRLAQAVTSVAEEELAESAAGVSVCHVPVRFAVDNKLFRLASNLRVVETKIRDNIITSRVSVVSVGELDFASLPGEVFPKVIRKLESQLASGRQTIWMGLSQDWLGYFVDAEDYDNGSLKYWTDLSVHRDGAKTLLAGLNQAFRKEECRNFEPIE